MTEHHDTIQKFFKDSKYEFELIEGNSYRFWIDPNTEYLKDSGFDINDEDAIPDPLECILSFNEYGESLIILYINVVIDVEVSGAILPEYYKLLNLINVKLAGTFVFYLEFEDATMLRYSVICGKNDLNNDSLEFWVSHAISSYLVAYMVISVFTESLMSAEDSIEEFERLMSDQMGMQFLN
jgi:hypothetical protein